MKKTLAIVLALCMVFALAACGETATTQTTTTTTTTTTATTNTAPAAPAVSADDLAGLDPVELVGADSSGKGADAQLLGELISKKVDEISGGKLTIDYHPNGDLGGDEDIARQTQSGDIDIMISQTAPLVSFIPEMAVFDLPMVFAKYDGATIDSVLNGDNEFHNSLAAAFEAAGYHLLGFLQNATYRETTSNKPLNTLADFKGMQIRTMSNANHMAFWSALGAEPTPLAWAEVFQALQTGMLDAHENAAATCVGANMQDVQKYFNMTNHILYCNQVMINEDNYNKLPEAYQAVLNQAVSEALAEIGGNLQKSDAENIKILQDGGMTVVTYDASFYDEVLAIQGVKDLYASIDAATNGLATKLQAALEAAGSAPAAAATIDASALNFDDLKPVELVGADSSGKGADAQLLGELITEKVAEITGGKLTIDYHPNGDLGGDEDIARQTQSGDIDIMISQTAPLVSFIPEMAVFDLPMVFAKYDGAKIDSVLNGDNEFHNSLAAAFEAAGYHLLGFLQNATYRETTSNKPLNTLADFKGLQIRTMSNANHMAFWSALGAEPTPLAWAEVFQALQTGMLDAHENAAATCVGANMQDVQKYFNMTNHILYCNQVMINEDNYNNLPEAYQQALNLAVQQALAEIGGNLQKSDAENIKILQDGGMTVVTYDASFYDEVLAIQGVKDLYASIDAATNGLATKLQAALAA